MSYPLDRRVGGFALALATLVAATNASADSITPGVVTPTSRVGGINASGMIVGAAQFGDASAPFRAFLTTADNKTTNLGTLGGSYSSATAVNAAGQVVGESNNTDDSTKQAFLYANGQLTGLGTLGGGYSSANAINNAGQVVGYSTTANEANTHAFLYSGGKMTDLGTLPGGNYSAATGINDAGAVVGQSTLANGSTNAFLYNNGQMTSLGTLGGTSSFAYGINNLGQVVGQSYTAKDASAAAFLYANGVMTNLGVLDGFKGSTARAINDAGMVVGTSFGKLNPSTGAFIQHAFAYNNGTMTDLNSLLPAGSGWVLTEAVGINNAGLISGIGTLNGVRTAFNFDGSKINAVPEPGTIAIFTLIGGGLALRTYRRRKA